MDGNRKAGRSMTGWIGAVGEMMGTTSGCMAMETGDGMEWRKASKDVIIGRLTFDCPR